MMIRWHVRMLVVVTLAALAGVGYSKARSAIADGLSPEASARKFDWLTPKVPVVLGTAPVPAMKRESAEPKPLGTPTPTIAERPEALPLSGDVTVTQAKSAIPSSVAE